MDIIFIDGPINLSAPKKAVPSVPNFNLFLNTADAYSFGSVIPSKLSSFVLAKALSKKLPSSSPNISPTDFVKALASKIPDPQKAEDFKQKLLS